ncbi:hypothetical protein AWH04_23675 [Rhodococcus erythropolis]|nr:hypothetical protein AWH04_23675 [Rhodococcus erythropolis]THJ70410.1 DUF1254 domain-containing protein [Rhodococcus qingshengii]
MDRPPLLNVRIAHTEPVFDFLTGSPRKGDDAADGHRHHDFMDSPTDSIAQGFTPAHAQLARSAGVPATLAAESYVEALARIVYYWGYPAVDTFGRTNMWEIMDGKTGLQLGLLPGAAKNYTGALTDYMSPAQRWVVSPNNDTIYGAGFADLTDETAVIQTPTEVPDGHYWTIQIVDVLTNVTHQLGSATGTPGGKFLLVGPDWDGELPEDFLDVLRSPTNVAGVFPRSFAARSEASKQQARSVLDQIGMYPFSEDRPGPRSFGYEAHAANSIYPQGVTAEMLAADPDASRPQWVKPESFWTDLAAMLDFNPTMGAADTPMADQAKTLVALHRSDKSYRALLDRAALRADVALHQSASYVQTGVDAGNGWQRQRNSGLWGTDWFGRALAAVIYIYVNDFHEAVYLVRGTDHDGALLHGRERYTMTFTEDALPPVDRSRGGFWSLTMYDKDAFMLADAPGNRVNLGTVNLDAGDLVFRDGKLTLHLSHDEPTDPDARANWLPAPHDEFRLIIRSYVPDRSVLDETYRFPDVVRATGL